MTIVAVVWTEGKTDAQHLSRAHQALKIQRNLDFKRTEGDDQLLKQCIALAMAPQICPTIFMFDRDNPEIVSKVQDNAGNYKVWGNNVFSFAIPIPDHRPDTSNLCIELYYNDEAIKTTDLAGRRLFLSSEFNANSGRHLTDPRLSVGHKGKLGPVRMTGIRVVDTEVYDDKHNNVALSKAEFATSIVNAVGSFKDFEFKYFSKIFGVIDNIIYESKTFDLLFSGFDEFCSELSEYEQQKQLAVSLEASLRIAKLTTLLFCAATIRFYDAATLDSLNIEQKKLRTLRQIIIENFTNPSLSTLLKLMRHCYHLINDTAPPELRAIRSLLSATPLLGAMGDLLDDIEKVIPPDRRQGRIINKRSVKKSLFDYLLPQLAKYESKVSAIALSYGESLQNADNALWPQAISTLIKLTAPLNELTLRLGRIDRLEGEKDEFIVLLTTYRQGRAHTEEVVREYGDLIGDRVETLEASLTVNGQARWLDLFPFLVLRNDTLCFYTRTRAAGYEYRAAFGSSIHIFPTKRKFSLAVFGSTIASDRQILFWTPVPPVTSEIGVKANIPAHDPNEFVGRGQQINDIIEEIIQIPNQNGIIFGPGGVGKTTLLIELSRKLFEERIPDTPIFNNIIWVSAKRDYYDPTLNLVEKGIQQFRSLEQVSNTILEFHGFENASEYTEDERQWLVLELLQEERTLLILDNFETIGRAAQKKIIRFFGVDVKRHLRKSPDNFKLLITSREIIPSGFHQINLKGLDRRDSSELMLRLDEPYRQSGHGLLTEAQRSELYDKTKGIPLIIKHCYGQIFEYNIPFADVLKNLTGAENAVVEFSFAEIFKSLREDELQKKIIIVLELINRPLLVRQISDILGIDETHIAEKITNLANFQCIVRSNIDIDEKYGINLELQVLSKKLVQDSMELAIDIKRKIAQLSLEKKIDYNKEEFDQFMLFQEFINRGQLAQAEDFIKESISGRPNSILLNLHYAKFLKEYKRQAAEAITRLEGIRQRSGNDPHVLRLLMMYNIALEPPNFDGAHIYAKQLEDFKISDAEFVMDIAWFYTEWATNIKMKFEIGDPLKEGLRQQRYKELSARAIDLLKSCPDKTTHKWHYLLAQCQFNKWEYDSARVSIELAIAALPEGSYLKEPYEQLSAEIDKKRRYFMKQA